ncbi:carboxymuconolactone decarboxylase family protein [Pseudomaricurvus alkylphenolicus]|jgi:AhpD family alkylhydroperoxidase|uniref:carboxymuconolactone decarboxylase family protein n=1 Tax=Pseudomaricurvus alkylphenolicus TaxID=1306991 RepID=UPI001420006E|nr:carboxymuconolactone decarboxylase family protein [Pseudomaricurvus alkylphenolicus]NIB38490.1 carboxymuconolactone decarboxylase family protein [Pseudomaricurvus alkylphenolicus]
MNIEQTRREIEQKLGQVPGWMAQMPDGALEGFWANARDFWLADTQIPGKYKELIGIALAGATRCRYCALFHTEIARVYGATDAEIAEASAMAATTMAGSTFINAQQIDYDEFRRETMEIVQYVKNQSMAQTQTDSTRPAAH